MSLEFPKVDLSGVNEAMGNLNASLEKFAEDIQKRKDNAMAMEFTRVICDLLKENGVTVQMTEIEEENHATNKFEVKYGFAFTELDFSEHDKKVAELKDRKIIDLEEEASELRKELISKNERIIELINKIEEIKKDWCFARMSELEDRHQSDCIRINQLLTTIDVLTERYQKLREVHGLG